MAKNRFDKVKGTKDFLVAGVVCAFICLWSIRDAWFPTEKILKRHPQEFPVTVAVSGVVQDVFVKIGDEIGGNAPLVTIHSEHFQEAVSAAEQAYKDSKGSGHDVMKEKLDALLKAREELDSTTVKASDFILKTTHGEDPLQGRVLQILVKPATEVEAGDAVIVVQPKDTFYVFNKTLSVLMFILAAVFLFFHRVASK